MLPHFAVTKKGKTFTFKSKFEFYRLRLSQLMGLYEINFTIDFQNNQYHIFRD